MTEDLVPGGVLSWEDPPPRAAPPRGERTETNWKLIAVQLKANPGEWALAATGGYAAGQHHRIVTGQSGHWAPAGSFEATTRRVDGVVHLWIRYLGPPEDVQEAG